MKKHYAKRNHMKQGKYYTDHLSAMTEEELDRKADIAGELAHRDMTIDELNCLIGKLERQPIPDRKVTNKTKQMKYFTEDGNCINLVTYDEKGNIASKGFISFYK